jgi:hypothetical protein
MPQPARLPDISDIDPSELMLAILVELERHGMGPEFRRVMHSEFGDLLDLCGGPRAVLAAAIAACRRGP